MIVTEWVVGGTTDDSGRCDGGGVRDGSSFHLHLVAGAWFLWIVFSTSVSNVRVVSTIVLLMMMMMIIMMIHVITAIIQVLIVSCRLSMRHRRRRP